MKPNPVLERLAGQSNLGWDRSRDSREHGTVGILPAPRNIDWPAGCRRAMKKGHLCCNSLSPTLSRTQVRRVLRQSGAAKVCDEGLEGRSLPAAAEMPRKPPRQNVHSPRGQYHLEDTLNLSPPGAPSR